MLNSIIKFFLDNKLVAWILLLVFIGWGLATAPFDFGIKWLPRDPVSVDAIPDIGENQQIVFTKWMGRSPQDVEDQITYPLTSSLLGIPGVKSIRSNSMFGISSVYVIFDEDVEFYWSRSRILEKLNSLPPNLLPQGVKPNLGPDATALGQIYWYTLEGRDNKGNATGGWDLHELRSIQDYYVRFGLSSASGVSEVASIGGYVKEYQVDADPDKMRVYGISMSQLMKGIKETNLDIGAQTLEINLAEYFVRGLGYVSSVEDIELAVVGMKDDVPIRVMDIARVNIGPATRRGVLDKSGAEAVGGVVVARYGANPLEVADNVKLKVAELAPGLPTKTLDDGTVSQVTIVPFYDRTKLINETLGTLEESLSLEILITIIVVILMLLNFKSSIIVSVTLPVAILMCFIAMRYLNVDANIVALSGIGIAIGTMVDIGIVITESILKRREEAPEGESLRDTVYKGTKEVASAVITAVVSTVVSFIPVFTMVAAEGKLFKPLAYTKTFALIASIVVAITIVPMLAHTIFSYENKSKLFRNIGNSIILGVGAMLVFYGNIWLGVVLAIVGIFGLLADRIQQIPSEQLKKRIKVAINILYALLIAWMLAKIWSPLGVSQGQMINFIFVVLIIGVIIGFFYMVIYSYNRILSFFLKNKWVFFILFFGVLTAGVAGFMNTEEEFMPALDEGSFLLMPTSMPHAGVEMNIANLKLLDMAVTAIPEVDMVVGKAGRVESSLDPAPMSMYENIILYKSEFKVDEKGHRLRFMVDANGDFMRTDNDDLIPDGKGKYFRNWRKHIKNPDDIWAEIVSATKLAGVTSAPKLQPIETRLVMLQTGMRAPMGIKVQGPDLKTIEAFGLVLEEELKKVPGIKESAVFAERIVGKPYLLIDIDRVKLAQYGLTIKEVQNQIQAAIGGMPMSTTVEGRERYNIRVRYPRELRDDPEKIKRILISAPGARQIQLGDVVDIKYEQGPQAIKSENGFLTGYVLFDRVGDSSEVEIVEIAQKYLDEKIQSNEIKIPPNVSYKFAGNYEQQQRASRRLFIVVPIALIIILLILYFQFRSILMSFMVFTGVILAFSGGFIMIGLYDTSWFMNFSLFDTNMRDLFQIDTINLSIAVWVGFLALFGIADDDGVLIGTYLKDSFKKNNPTTIPEIRSSVVIGGKRRVRAAMMTSATTILALLPILTSTGKGADIMLPMAIPSVGGMLLQMLTMFTVPFLYCLCKEATLKRDLKRINKISAS